MHLKIWGCRGSVPAPGSHTAKYGGNTSCIEVAVDDGMAIVLDAGTGIRALGLDLVARGTRRIHLFLTHLHLDHLEGLRFFAPLWDERVTIEIWGPRSPVSSLRDRIHRAFSPPLFPLDFRDVPARVTFHDLPGEPWRSGGITLTADLVLHPGPTLGFRVESDGATLAYLPDHEPALAGIDGRSPDWISAGGLAHAADLVLHDSQFSEEEYDTKIGWGHSSVADAVAFCRAVGARRLVLFHHEPEHSDRVLEELEQRARALTADDREPPLLAREGMTLELG
ncbi:MAG TPA: MBL fold metallo-hydrolase [Gaiellaceae bacterium]|nr:MBL fold metallo-hydrolase [Gaiellaceae bacterium]